MRNTNPRSPDYGLSLWVGVPSFDYRYERLSDEEYVQWDIGTATYHLCDSAPQHLGRRLVPRPGVAQRPARSAAADPARRRRHAGQRTVRPYHAGGSGADGHELRVGSPRHFRRRTANPQPEYPDRRVARSDGRSFSSRNDGSYETQPISAQIRLPLRDRTTYRNGPTGNRKLCRIPAIRIAGRNCRRSTCEARRSERPERLHCATVPAGATDRAVRLSLPYRR